MQCGNKIAIVVKVSAICCGSRTPLGSVNELESGSNVTKEGLVDQQFNLGTNQEVLYCLTA
jgi:hypothetical protein